MMAVLSPINHQNQITQSPARSEVETPVGIILRETERVLTGMFWKILSSSPGRLDWKAAADNPDHAVRHQTPPTEKAVQ